MKRKSEKRRPVLKTLPMCFVNIKNKDGTDDISKGLFLEASHEFEQDIINRGYRVYTTTVEPQKKTILILFDLNNCDGEKLKEEELVHMMWELEKDFEFRIVCKAEISPNEKEDAS